MTDETGELLELAAYALAAFRKKSMRIATAESCTGGLVAALLTEIPGSSDVFDRGFVTYSNAAKTEMLGVPAEMIAEKGAVSSETAMAMAIGALQSADADAAAAITGIAGPAGGSRDKPVGLVYVAVSGPEGTFVEELRLGDLGRKKIRNQSALTALEMLVAFCIEDGDDTPPATDSVH